jgi:8-oxo-dGTP diphosphatase
VEALARELREELGIESRSCHPLLQLRHHYPDCEVLLEVFVVEQYHGVPAALEGQPLQWVSVASLPQQSMVPADRPIVDAILAYEESDYGSGHRTARYSAR